MDNTRKVLVILLVICAVLQVMLAPNIAIGGVSPNFMLLPAVCAGIIADARQGCIFGFTSGLIFDLSTTGPLGAMTFILTLVGFLVGVFANDLLSENWLMPVGVLLVASLLTEILHVIISAMFGVAPFFHSLIFVALPGTVYDTVFGFLCFPLLRSRISSSGSMKISSKSTSGMHVKNINLR